MIIRTQDKFMISTHHMKSKIVLNARIKVISYNMNSTEELLNDYFIDTENKPLKQVCLELINKIHINYDDNKDIFITFLNPKDDDKASLISYGDGKLLGSNILFNAFSL